MARTVAQRNWRQLWTEVKKPRECKSTMTNCMDKKVGSENIVELFSDKYQELYNSVKYDHDQLAIIRNNNMCPGVTKGTFR